MRTGIDLRQRKPLLAAATAATLVLTGAGIAGAHLASAATAGCRVVYTVTSQWQGGFGANVDITNLGDAVNGWRLTWTFADGQTVTQAWNATITLSGGAATATNMSYNASIGTGSTVSFGFNGAWTSANAVPSSFADGGCRPSHIKPRGPGELLTEPGQRQGAGG